MWHVCNYTYCISLVEEIMANLITHTHMHTHSLTLSLPTPHIYMYSPPHMYFPPHIHYYSPPHSTSRVSGKEIQALMQKQTGGSGGGEQSSGEEEASLNTEDRPPKPGPSTLAATSATPSPRPTTPSKSHSKGK